MAQVSEARQRLALPVSALRWQCDPSIFPFETTTELPSEEVMIGQERAVRALDFGLTIRQPGYNIFVSGPVGTGRTTYTTRKIVDLARGHPAPVDWCYVYNFDEPDRPIAIGLEPGGGSRFRRDMDDLVSELKDGIRKLMASEYFATRRTDALRSYERRINEIWQTLETEARRLGFALQRTPAGILHVPIGTFGEPLPPDVLDKMPEEQKKALEERARTLQEKIGDALRQVRNLEREAREELRRLEADAVRAVAQRSISPLKERYASNPRIIEYHDDLLNDVVENLDAFKEEEEEPRLPFPGPPRLGREERFRRYRVNLFVDNSRSSGAPAVFETNPTYYNLIGKIEYRGEFGALVTDFTMIKPGALHKANGGYLMLQLKDLILAPVSWEALKRALKSREIRIENLAEQFGLLPTATLRPEPIPLHVKVAIIGSTWQHHLLYMIDEDFRKLFRIKADFDLDMERSEVNLTNYAKAISAICAREGLRPLHRDAVARVVEYSVRLAQDQEKLSGQFNEVAEILTEASAWAERNGAQLVSAEHVRKALEEKVYRSNRLEERIREAIRRGMLLVDIDGAKVGHVNGLAVYSLGDYSFGRPNRITARTYVGARGVMNIERETQLSGRIHSKGVFILTNYMGGRYAQERPLSLNASLTFEQTYDEVEGDSASSTELYTLLSDLAQAPIDQGIGVTGSVNQWGEIQPIGGANEKIEGFFYVCKAMGLTGRQGVIIPAQNTRNLMLRDEVVEAVRDGKFKIWAVRTVDEGLEVLTGVPAGQLEAGGRYPEGTLNARVAKRLDELAERLRRFAPIRAGREDGTVPETAAQVAEEGGPKEEPEEAALTEDTPPSQP